MYSRIAIALFFAAFLNTQARACEDQPVAAAAPVNAAQVASVGKARAATPKEAPAGSWNNQAKFFPLSKAKVVPRAVRSTHAMASPLAPAAPALMPWQAPAAVTPAPAANAAARPMLSPEQAQKLLSVYQ